jgi:hypothetical protein
MIPYDLIITASHRPHLLEPTLTSLLAMVDQPPARIVIHDDAAPPFQATLTTGPDHAALREETKAALLRTVPHGIPLLYTWADPPRKLGMALRFLLDNVTTEYVLYSQDDFVTVRPLPIRDALETMDQNSLHQIRFNKRATLSEKRTWQGIWKKEEITVPVHLGGPTTPVPLTISDHWYFQTGLWRVQPIQAAIAWLTETESRRRLLYQMVAEEAINKVIDGHLGPIPDLIVPHPDESMEPMVRREIQRTFIWGPVGENRFTRHIGGGDPTAQYERDGGVDDPKLAWREIEEERRNYGQ